MSMVSFVRGLFGFDSTPRRTGVKVERTANALVTGDDAQVTALKLATAYTDNSYLYQFIPVASGVTQSASDVDPDDLVEETLAADLSVEELVKQRKQIV